MKFKFKNDVQELAANVVVSDNPEKEIDQAVDWFLSRINWGQIIGLVFRKIFGRLK